MSGIICNEKDVSNVNKLCSVLYCIGQHGERRSMSWSNQHLEMISNQWELERNCDC
jgi:hypothetical protein